MNTIPQELIERALALTGKTMEDIQSTYMIYDDDFSKADFCYFLLSPEFIEKYRENSYFEASHYYSTFGYGIGEYQSGNPEPLISLLSKIECRKK